MVFWTQKTRGGVKKEDGMKLKRIAAACAMAAVAAAGIFVFTRKQQAMQTV